MAPTTPPPPCPISRSAMLTRADERGSDERIVMRSSGCSLGSLSARRIDSEFGREPVHVGRLAARVQEVAAVTKTFLYRCDRCADVLTRRVQHVSLEATKILKDVEHRRDRMRIDKVARRPPTVARIPAICRDGLTTK
jgi:hypothetical protein